MPRLLNALFSVLFVCLLEDKLRIRKSVIISLKLYKLLKDRIIYIMNFLLNCFMAWVRNIFTYCAQYATAWFALWIHSVQYMHRYCASYSLVFRAMLNSIAHHTQKYCAVYATLLTRILKPLRSISAPIVQYVGTYIAIYSSIYHAILVPIARTMPEYGD